MCWQSGTPGTFLHAQLSREKKSSQFNTLEGIPHESKILIGVRFAFRVEMTPCSYAEFKSQIISRQTILGLFLKDVLAKWHAGHILHAQLSQEKKSSQFNTLEGIPDESKILIGVRFAFRGSVLSFGFDQAKNEIDQSHALLTIIYNEHFHQRSYSVKLCPTQSLNEYQTHYLCSFGSAMQCPHYSGLGLTEGHGEK